MAVLAGMVKNVLVIIILASFLEVLLPEGRVKPFVRFAIGLFIIIAVLNPVLNALFEQREFEINLWDYKVSSEQEREILEKGNRINQQIVVSTEAGIKEKMEGQVSAVAMLVPGVKEVKTNATLNDEGRLNKLDLTVRLEQSEHSQKGGEVNVFLGEGDVPSAEDKKQIEEKMRGVINNLYGFQNLEINVQFEGG
ncbi:MAG: stage III sporulation protein AF [Syntrophomonadaceae bacterium]|nr:stage III sporulation protein AF [Syntrophomonadaceae bacterium]MDD3898159.1 stage III sporulation protein AF [Syntrophomonadaceae bacterium]